MTFDNPISRLEEDDRAGAVVDKRLTAYKRLASSEIGGPKTLPETLAQCAVSPGYEDEPVDGEYSAVFSFGLARENRVSQTDAFVLIRSLRRALMSLSRETTGQVSRLFSGHEPDGRPDHSPRHAHVYLAADGGNEQKDIARLIVAAPWAVNRLSKPLFKERQEFDRVVRRLDDLRAGRLGRFRLRALPLEEGDPLLGLAATWKGVTPYLATRNLKKKDNPVDVVTQNITVECSRRGLPSPRHVDVSNTTFGPRGGNVKSQVTLHFATAVRGPILLGRDSHQGGGLFRALPDGARQEIGSTGTKTGAGRKV